MQIGSMPQMTNQVGPGARPPGPPGGPHQAAMDGAADALGLSETELRDRLQSGDTLADIASDVGVETEDLKAAMLEAVEESAPADVVDRIASDLDDMITGSRPAQRPPPPPQANPADALQVLASALDLSAEDLFTAIENGTFADLLKSEGVATERGMLVDQQSKLRRYQRQRFA